MVDPTAIYISNTAPWPSLDKVVINPRHDMQTRAYLMNMCLPIMDSTTVGPTLKAPTPLLWRGPKAASIVGEHMCIKYARVCVSCLGLMNPLSRAGQGAVLDMYAAVGSTMG